MAYTIGMLAIEAHFDGKVIVPDEPLNLKPQQRLWIHVEAVNEPREQERQAAIQSLRGMALRAPANPNP